MILNVINRLQNKISPCIVVTTSCFYLFKALLIHITCGNPGEESVELKELRETAHDLQRRSVMLETGGDELRAEELHTEAQRKERDVMRLMTTNR